MGATACTRQATGHTHLVIIVMLRLTAGTMASIGGTTGSTAIMTENTKAKTPAETTALAGTGPAPGADTKKPPYLRTGNGPRLVMRSVPFFNTF